MSPKSMRLLYHLLWAADAFMCPRMRNLTESFEAWASRRGLRHDMESLEHQGFLERHRGYSQPSRFCPTERGRLVALGGRDPVQCWRRPWDGHWRLVVFDVPEKDHARRNRLRRTLRRHGLGFLQRSVYVTPDPLRPLVRKLGLSRRDVRLLISWEAVQGSGESNAAIVGASWDFRAINERYMAYFEVLARVPSFSSSGGDLSQRWNDWLEEERDAWWAAVSIDPFLPQRLLPRGYLGRHAWQRRASVFRRIAPTERPT